MKEIYTNCDLQGKSFKKNPNLSGVNFSGSDLRGTSFEGAILEKADFTDVQCGLTRFWAYLFFFFFLLQITMSSIPLAITGWWLTFFILPQTIREFTILPFLTIISISFWLIYLIIFRKEEKTPYLIATGAFAIAIATILAVFSNFMQISVGFGISILSAVIGTGTSLIGASAIIGTYLLGKGKFKIYKKKKNLVRQWSGLYVLAIIILSAILVAYLCAKATAAINSAVKLGVGEIVKEAGYGEVSMILSAAAGVASVLLSGVVAFRNIRSQYQSELVGEINLQPETASETDSENKASGENFNWIKDVAVYLTSLKGTNFNGANLKDSNFTGARLENTNLVKANIIRTRWKNAENLMWARVPDSYLEITAVRNLVVSLEGEGKSFKRLLNLRGVNLKGANLINANFEFSDLKESNFENATITGADFTESMLIDSNLRNADLREAQLVRTQLDKADLSGANLTGACIDHWNITENTKHENIKCEYVFLACGNEMKRPDYKERFDDGEFAQFVFPMLGMVDVYVNEDADFKTMIEAFKELKRNNPEAELEIKAIEQRGANGILFKFMTSKSCDKKQLVNDFHEIYNNFKLLTAPERKQLSSKNENVYQINDPFNLSEDADAEDSVETKANEKQ